MAFPSDDAPKLMVRFSEDMRSFIEQQAEKYGSSMNSEVLRCIRERMDRVEDPAAHLSRLRHEQKRIAAEIAALEVEARP